MESVNVEIFGQKYSIKGMAHADRIQELAAFVDTTMRDIQKGTGTMESHRVAILAALTISEELYRLRELVREQEHSTGRSLQHLLDITDRSAEHLVASLNVSGTSQDNPDRMP